MKLEIVPAAQKFYEDEMGINEKRGVRILGKVYGESAIHEGFSIAIEAAEPTNPLVLVRYNDIPYFIEETDEWFFESFDLFVEFDDELKEPVYHFMKDGVEQFKPVHKK
ncbi:HesB/YadR/YfhF family protein [Atopobacter phocae]|uniref:HesB/YadR/YfhF family protein n=1 Tax=Atopobacter phocae TaxID=136492 RepID=UPI000472C8B8|nr:hypothetical protein [Atopobacter phocae]